MVLMIDWWLAPTLLTVLSLVWLFSPLKPPARSNLEAARVAIAVLVVLSINLAAWLLWSLCA